MLAIGTSQITRDTARLAALRLAQVGAQVNDTTEIGALVGSLLDTLKRSWVVELQTPVRTGEACPEADRWQLVVRVRGA